MGRYNIPKQDSKQLIKEIRNSSNGDGGGVKEYYYKYNYDPNFNESTKIFMLIEVLYNNQDEIMPINKNFTNYGIEEALSLLIDRYCVAIKILDSEVIYFTYDSDNPYIRFPKGSIIDKVLYLAKKEGLSEDQTEEFINTLKSVFVEITKEEYESLITYKP